MKTVNSHREFFAYIDQQEEAESHGDTVQDEHHDISLMSSNLFSRRIAIESFMDAKRNGTLSTTRIRDTLHREPISEGMKHY